MSGLTRSIRLQLGFTDEKQWKLFSTRRLELIDKFNLSSKKASEQDDSITQIADLLREEFHFAPDTLGEFDKLVRAAVQSARRNRKRSSRAKVPSDRFVYEDKKTQFQQHTNPPHTNSATMTPTLVASPSHTLPPFRALSVSLHTPHDLSQSKQKLLSTVHKSKSCLLLSNNDPSIHEENLHRLGKSIITASISFILERYFADIPTDSINYLCEQLESAHTLAGVVRSLGVSSNDVMILLDHQASSLLAKLIGCCVKDFGFDQVSYLLSEMFHEIVLSEYPLVATQVQRITPESLYTPLMPIKPRDADSEISKRVQLQYGHRVLDFTYAPLSSAPPTYLELLENGKTAFGIQNKNLRLRLEGQDATVEVLERVFRDIDKTEILLELYEPAMRFTPLL